ncbi:hypothetical protein [Dactylosporangium sp. NPDC048998]|uniref:hypothetical protein n=1 Tax=Dactylosporangium sp. NPDC048998 TaxID=3363976 RepID=UPI003720839D
MTRWWFGWLRWWQGTPFALRSPLSVAEAVAALNADRATILRGSGVRVVVGRISPDLVRLTSKRRSSNNAWRPVLRARFRPLPGGGCELIGSFDIQPLVPLFTTLWLILGLTGLIVGLAGVRSVSDLAPLAAPLGALALVVTIAAVGTRAGHRDEEHLRRWIERRLCPQP